MALPADQQHHYESSLVDALTRGIEAGQRLIIDRIELLRLDALELLGRAERGGLLIVFGAMLAMVGWIGIGAAVVVWLTAYLTPAASAAIVGAIHLAAGATLAGAGIHYARTAVPGNSSGDSKNAHDTASPPEHGAQRRWSVADEYDRV